MSNAKMMVQGNLALALDMPAQTVRHAGFSVVEGSAAKRPAATGTASRVKTVTAAAPACVPRPALHAVVMVAFAAAVMLSLVFATFAARSVAYADSVAAVSYQTIDVMDGDTIWDIAAAHPAKDLTTQETVKLIEEKNGLDSAVLHAGETLEVPVSSVSR